ncbi:uncharacterized protein LOC135219714 [Macrobrachium nipponense]|uniref:uncharacterized protein LOC135219714 n=1 Tax=Macrobrachium nipponense TaxID=159736 RepID=UPI0030C87D09
MPKKRVEVLCNKVDSESKDESVSLRQQRLTKVHPYPTNSDSSLRRQANEQRTLGHTPDSECPNTVHPELHISEEQTTMDMADQSQLGHSTEPHYSGMSGNASFQQNRQKQHVILKEIPPPNKDFNHQGLQLDGNSQLPQRKQQIMSTSQAPGNVSSLRQLQDCGQEIQQNKNKNINEILERIHQTCAVQKQEASQLKTLTGQKLIHSKGHLIKPQLGHQQIASNSHQRPTLISEQQNQGTYSHENKENEKQEIRHHTYIPRQQTGQQVRKDLNNQNHLKRGEENVRNSSHYHQHPNHFSNSRIPVQQNRYSNQQYTTQQSGQQRNLQSGQIKPYKKDHTKPSWPSKKKTRKAEIQNVQQIITTFEGQRIVQHPHIFDPKIHAPLIIPCSLSAAPVLPVSSAVTLPLYVDTSLEYEPPVLHQSPYVPRKYYHNVPTEHKEISGCSDSKQLDVENQLLITVADLHRAAHFHPLINSLGIQFDRSYPEHQKRQIQGGLLNRSPMSDSTFSFSPESNSLIHPDNSHLLNTEKWKSTVPTKDDSNPLQKHVSQDLLQNLTNSELIDIMPISVSSSRFGNSSELISHSYNRLSKSCSNLVASNSVSQQLWVIMVEPNTSVESQKSPNCQQQALTMHRSYSAPDLRTYHRRCSDLESSYPGFRKMCANSARPNEN